MVKKTCSCGVVLLIILLGLPACLALLGNFSPGAAYTARSNAPILLSLEEQSANVQLNKPIHGLEREEISSPPVSLSCMLGLQPLPVSAQQKAKSPARQSTAQELSLDDGELDDIIGLSNGGQFLWLNRFTPDPNLFPMRVTRVQAMFYQRCDDSTGVCYGPNVGDNMEIVVMQDPDGDGDPSNATVVYTQWVTVYNNNGQDWNEYELSTPVNFDSVGDILIGMVNRSGYSGYLDYPAVIDYTSSQGRSWFGSYASGYPPPDPPTMPPTGYWNIIDNAGFPGNWMIRAWAEPVLKADFSGCSASGTVPLVVPFTNNSTGAIDHWQWDFGDGEYDESEWSPTHTYYERGTYTVTLHVWDAAYNESVIVKEACVTATNPPVPSFTADPTDGEAPLDVNFMDTSTGAIDSWSWAFGDGGHSSDQNTTHTYTKAGTFRATLTVSGPDGSATSNVTTITVRESAPVASFTASPTTGQAPLRVSFTDASRGAITSRAWTFGDGGSSSQKSPTYTYQNAGTFTATLTVTGPGGSSSKSVTIKVKDSAPVASFTANPTTGPAPLNVSFKDTSKGNIASWKWVFGDGKSSLEQSPAHIYEKAGKFTATLTVTGPGGSSSKSATINVQDGAPVASFTASPTTGPAPLDVSFKDASTGNITSWEWAFGDEETSSERSPTHTYKEAGTFTATLTVTGPGGSASKNATIKVTQGKPRAVFTATPQSGPAPLVVQFDSSASGPNITKWNWKFGDGKSSTEKNPNHTYNDPGAYTVSLTVSNAAGSDTATGTVHVTLMPDFEADKTTGPAPLAVVFTDKTKGTIVSRIWDFGDGHNSTDQNPHHTYTKEGSYTVKLTVTPTTGDPVSKTKPNYIKVTPSPYFKASGRVATKNGEPFSKVLITFTTESGGGVPDAVETGEDGRWSQTGFQRGTTYRIIPRLKGYVLTPALRSVSEDRNNLDFEVSGFRVSGKVTTPGGSAIAKTMITFARVSGKGTVPAPVLTDGRGNWSQTDFEPGTLYRVTPSKRKYIFDPLVIQFNGPTSHLNFEGTMKTK